MLAEYARLGAVPVLGYPISRRFQWRGRTTQVTQRGVLQWDESQGEVALVNIFDYLNENGWDGWLRERRLIPKQLPPSSAEAGLSWDDIVKIRMQLLDQDQQIKSYYLSTPNAIALYGLPTSNAENFGPFVAMRFQRATLQRWQMDSDAARAGQITAVNAGELAKDLGVFPRAAVEPENAPERSRTPVSRGSSGGTRGVATWYGADFQGSLMRNGEPFDMYNPGIAASNSHPIGTRLRVTSLTTGYSVIVTVADTGAFRYPIIVDLSWAAFRQIADPDAGVIEVTVEPLRDS